MGLLLKLGGTLLLLPQCPRLIETTGKILACTSGNISFSYCFLREADRGLMVNAPGLDPSPYVLDFSTSVSLNMS